MQAWLDAQRDPASTATRAVYFPRVRDPRPAERGPAAQPSGRAARMAGLYAATDVARGVWKAPAGHRRTAAERAGPRLRPHRPRERRRSTRSASTACAPSRSSATSPGAPARSTAPTSRHRSGSTSRSGASRSSSRRACTAARKWVVFEPNDEPLWAQIRLNVGAFMHDLFRQGAFQGSTPRDAYFVKCDAETTTQNDIDHGHREHPRRASRR